MGSEDKLPARSSGDGDGMSDVLVPLSIGLDCGLTLSGDCPGLGVLSADGCVSSPSLADFAAWNSGQVEELDLEEFTEMLSADLEYAQLDSDIETHVVE